MGELRKVFTKFKRESCDPQGHNAFGIYLILFIIVYMIVKLGWVL